MVIERTGPASQLQRLSSSVSNAIPALTDKRSVLDSSLPIRVPGIKRSSLFQSFHLLKLKPKKRSRVSFGALVSESSWVRDGNGLLPFYQGKSCHRGSALRYSKSHDLHRTYYVYSRPSAVLARESRPASKLSVGSNDTGFGPWLSKSDTDDQRREQSTGEATLQTPEGDDADENVGAREKLRRLRIGMANKGKVPWNKGRQHSPETIERIRQRTCQAMHSPEVKAKLKLNPRHPQSEVTRLKIRDKLREQWDLKKKIRGYQEACLKDWKECVAEAARVGASGEEEYGWDSYSLIQRSLHDNEQTARKSLTRVSKSRPPKSDEHRQKISAAIRAKWEDPEYQQKVRDGMTKTGKVSTLQRRKSVTPGTGVFEKKTRSEIAMDQSFIDAVMSDEKPSRTSRSQAEEPDKQRTVLTSIPAVKPPVKLIKKVNLLQRVVQKSELQERVYIEPTMPVEGPATPKSSGCKDSKANEKHQKLKLLQANRAIMEQRRKESACHARLLMAEAEKAARALEAAAARDESAMASLSETRRLMAEAARLIQSAESGRSRLTSSNQSS